MKKETDRCSFPQNLFDPLQKKPTFAASIQEAQPNTMSGRRAFSLCYIGIRDYVKE